MAAPEVDLSDLPGPSTEQDYDQWGHVVECPICYMVYDKPHQMSCGHTLCSICVGQLISRARAEPVDLVLGNNLEEMIQAAAMNFAGGNVVGLGGNAGDVGGMAGIAQQIDAALGGRGGLDLLRNGEVVIDIPRLDPRDPGFVRGEVAFQHRRMLEIKCPECRKPTIVPNEGLPVNYRVQEMVRKLAPLIKERPLIRKCTNCPSALNQGIFFNCNPCNKQRICPTCAIRHHNGHDVVEKKSMTSKDVEALKLKVDAACQEAHQALETMKPKIQGIGRSVEAEVLAKMDTLLDLFGQISRSIEGNITETTTIADLEERVAKAERITQLFKDTMENVEMQLANTIKNAVDIFVGPFEAMHQEIGVAQVPPRAADGAPQGDAAAPAGGANEPMDMAAEAAPVAAPVAAPAAAPAAPAGAAPAPAAPAPVFRVNQGQVRAFLDIPMHRAVAHIQQVQQVQQRRNRRGPQAQVAQAPVQVVPAHMQPRPQQQLPPQQHLQQHPQHQHPQHQHPQHQHPQHQQQQPHPPHQPLQQHPPHPQHQQQWANPMAGRGGMWRGGPVGPHQQPHQMMMGPPQQPQHQGPINHQGPHPMNMVGFHHAPHHPQQPPMGQNQQQMGPPPQQHHQHQQPHFMAQQMMQMPHPNMHQQGQPPQMPQPQMMNGQQAMFNNGPPQFRPHMQQQQMHPQAAMDQQQLQRHMQQQHYQQHQMHMQQHQQQQLQHQQQQHNLILQQMQQNRQNQANHQNPQNQQDPQNLQNQQHIQQHHQPNPNVAPQQNRRGNNDPQQLIERQQQQHLVIQQLRAAIAQNLEQHQRQAPQEALQDGAAQPANVAPPQPPVPDQDWNQVENVENPREFVFDDHLQMNENGDADDEPLAEDENEGEGRPLVNEVERLNAGIELFRQANRNLENYQNEQINLQIARAQVEDVDNNQLPPIVQRAIEEDGQGDDVQPNRVAFVEFVDDLQNEVNAIEGEFNEPASPQQFAQDDAEQFVMGPVEDLPPLEEDQTGEPGNGFAQVAPQDVQAAVIYAEQQVAANAEEPQVEQLVPIEERFIAPPRRTNRQETVPIAEEEAVVETRRMTRRTARNVLDEPSTSSDTAATTASVSTSPTTIPKKRKTEKKPKEEEPEPMEEDEPEEQVVVPRAQKRRACRDQSTSSQGASSSSTRTTRSQTRS